MRNVLTRMGFVQHHNTTAQRQVLLRLVLCGNSARGTNAILATVPERLMLRWQERQRDYCCNGTAQEGLLLQWQQLQRDYCCSGNSSRGSTAAVATAPEGLLLQWQQRQRDYCCSGNSSRETNAAVATAPAGPML